MGGAAGAQAVDAERLETATTETKTIPAPTPRDAA